MADTVSPIPIERLRAIRLFHELDDSALEAIAATASEFEVTAGHVLVQPNMEAAGMFLIEDGTVSVEAPALHTQRGAGECVGELALLAPGLHRTARVQAKTPVRGIAIAREQFEELLTSQPPIALGLLRVLAARLAEAAGA
ncbi:MAG: cyclic nucleotide-binding domain-containing protein [Actinomycetota bacterium]